jgi:hypothetical protein
MLQKWLLNSAAFFGILYFVFRVLKHRFYVSTHDARAFTFVRSCGSSPQHLVVVVNGLFGKAIGGRHVVDVVIEEAERKGEAIVAARLQVSDLFNGLQLFSEGVDAASKKAVSLIKQISAEYPSVKRVSLMGSSFGGLVLREAAPQLELELSTLVCMCSPHSGAPQLKSSWWMRLLMPFVPLQCLRDMQDAELLERLGGAEARFAQRVVVGSPHDETVTLSNATLGVVLSPDLVRQPLHAQSQLLFERLESWKSCFLHV